MGVRIRDECIEAVPGRLGLGLDLQGIVSSPADIPEFQNGVEVWWSKGRNKGSAAGGATKSIGSSGNACRRTVGVDGVTGDQDVVAVRTGVAHSEYDVARQLALDVRVVLQDLSGPGVPRLEIECSRERGNSWWSVKNWKSARDAGDGPARATGRGAAGWSRNWATAELEDIALGEKGRVLPKALRALAPRGIVVDGEAPTDYGFVAAEDLIGGADARFEIFPIHIYSCGAADSVLIGNQQLARSGVRSSGDGGWKEIGHAPSGFGDGCRQGPS